MQGIIPCTIGTGNTKDRLYLHEHRWGDKEFTWWGIKNLTYIRHPALSLKKEMGLDSQGQLPVGGES